MLCAFYAALAQSAEHVLGKDEVPGSKPGGGSLAMCRMGTMPRDLVRLPQG